MNRYALKYWLKHKKQAMLVIMSILLSMVILMDTTFLVRSSMATEYAHNLSEGGDYNFIFADISREETEALAESGMFEEIGILYTVGVLQAEEGIQYPLTACDIKGAELYLPACEEGRYPDKEDELAASADRLKQLGMAPIAGSSVTLTVLENGEEKEKTYRVSGVLEDMEREWYSQAEYEFSFPEFFVYRKELPEEICCVVANEAAGMESEELYSFLDENGYVYSDPLTKVNVDNSYINSDSIWRSDVDSHMESAQMNFDSAVLIPLLSVVIAVFTFFSLVFALSIGFRERRNALCLYGLFGLPKRRGWIQLGKEMLVFLVSATGLGYLIGLAVYALLYLVQSKLLHMLVVSGMHVNQVIEAVSLNPYVFPALVIFQSGIFACAMVLLSMKSPSPLEAVSKLKGVEKRKGRIKGSRLREYMNRCLSPGQGEKHILFTVILLTMATVFFSILYLSENYASEAEAYQAFIEEADLNQMDYQAKKDFSKSMGLLGITNRRSGGITEQNYVKLKNMKNVESIKGMLEIKSTRVLAEENQDNLDMKSYLEVIQGEAAPLGVEDLYYKGKEAEGYQKNELGRLYNIPTVAVDTAIFEAPEIASYRLSGQLDLEKLKSGEQVVVFVSDKDAQCPYELGDIIHMAETVIEDEEMDNFDFSTGKIPEKAKPAFQYQYWDEETGSFAYEDGYSFGKRMDYEVQVGAVVYRETGVNDFYYTDGLFGSSAFIFLASAEALDAWGIPDRNYTRVGVKMKNLSQDAEFESLWYQILAESQDMTSDSVADVRRKIQALRWEGTGIVVLLFLSLLVLGFVTVFNYIQMKMLHDSYTIGVYRMLGTKRRTILLFWIKKLAGYIALAACVAWFPLALYEWRRRLLFDIYGMETENGAEVMIMDGSEEGWLTSIQGGWGDLMRMPYVKIYVAAICLCAIIFIVNMMITLNRTLDKKVSLDIFTQE